MQKLYKSRASKGRRSATIKRADAEAVRGCRGAIQIKGPQRDEKGDNKDSGCTMLYRSRAPRWRRRATIKRADAEAIQIKGLRRDKKGDNKESGSRGYTDQVPAK